MPALRGGPHARRTGRGLSESEEGALRYRRLQERAPPSGRGRAARLRVRLGRRAPLHRLHDVPGRAPVPHLHGRTDPARPARLDGRGAAVARSPARRRRSLDARQHLRWTPDPGPGSWRRPRRVRRLPALDGRVPRALRGIRGDAAARPGGGLLRVRRPVRPPATRGDPPGAVQDLPRPDLRRGRLAGVDADHGEARGGHPRHPAEALARGRQGARRLPHDVPGHQPDGGATARVRGLDLLRRERGARPRDGASLHRRLLPDRPRPLQLPGRPPREDQGLRVLRQDGQEDRAVRHRQGDRVLHEPPGLGHAGAVLREDSRRAGPRRQRHLRRRLQLRRHGLRRGGAEHAPVRAHGDARAQEAPAGSRPGPGGRRAARRQRAHGRAEPADLYEDGGGRVTLRIFDMKKPVIAAINGPAVGFGITLTLPMDIRIASTAARIGFVFTRRGVVPEACSTWFLPRLVGPSQAAEWVLTGRVFDGEEARAGGLVSRVVAPEALLPTARELALEIARNTSAVAVALARQMLWRLLGADHPMEAHRLDSQAMFWTGRSTDAYEGVTAFLEKRPPRFTRRPSQDMPPFYPWWQPRAFK